MPEETEDLEKKKSFSFQMIMLIVTLALLAFMIFVYLHQSGMWDKLFASSPQEAKATSSFIYIFEQNFLVNLSDKDVLRYLKMTLGVEISDQRVVEEIKNKTVEIRDAIITLVSAQTSEDLSTTEGKEKLKLLIADSINSFLTSGKVTKVYFVDFVMQ
ncbi:MAG: flagellar basal body-associated FliL family protein [Atribacterota bacterium]|jgi:flagellar FliL protein|nr:flagellar basal body-associated FliL family protein [Atribacterota bacterium]MDI9608105.1 flagellar basal body-associated FliL family protein [Atribacterota bacterium]MDY0135496.1 flagellar basal body-associated FliL family protein [Atribacterota bacterium]HQE24401.1 flagellar basal body-associated FliL family protein [Candidatus Atribacteria bacterium]